MNQVDFLNTPIGQWPEDPEIPPGDYRMRLVDLQQGWDEARNAPTVEAEFQILAPLANVDQQALAAVENWQSRGVKNSFRLAIGAARRNLTEMCQAMNMPATASLAEGMERLKNRTVIVHMETRGGGKRAFASRFSRDQQGGGGGGQPPQQQQPPQQPPQQPAQQPPQGAGGGFSDAWGSGGGGGGSAAPGTTQPTGPGGNTAGW